MPKAVDIHAYLAPVFRADEPEAVPTRARSRKTSMPGKSRLCKAPAAQPDSPGAENRDPTAPSKTVASKHQQQARRLHHVIRAWSDIGASPESWQTCCDCNLFAKRDIWMPCSQILAGGPPVWVQPVLGRQIRLSFHKPHTSYDSHHGNNNMQHVSSQMPLLSPTDSFCKPDIKFKATVSCLGVANLSQ